MGIYETPDESLMDLYEAMEGSPDAQRAIFQEYQIQKLRSEMKQCTACDLRSKCTQVVPFYGPAGGIIGKRVSLCVLGEAPGGDEDAVGKPFIGESGRIVDRIFAEFGIKREDVPFVNVVGCRPWAWDTTPWGARRKKDRAPNKEEISACRDWLHQQLLMINPWMILCLGATAARVMMSGVSIKNDHGKLNRVEVGKPGTLEGWEEKHCPLVICTYHPGAVMGYRDKTGENMKIFRDDIREAAFYVKARETFMADHVEIKGEFDDLVTLWEKEQMELQEAEQAKKSGAFDAGDAGAILEQGLL